MNMDKSNFLFREDLLRIEFSVSKLIQQSEPWNTGGLIGIDFPQGWMAEFEPVLKQPWSDHIALGLKVYFKTQDGQFTHIQHDTGRIQDGKLTLFFAGDRCPVSIGQKMMFVEKKTTER